MSQIYLALIILVGIFTTCKPNRQAILTFSFCCLGFWYIVPDSWGTMYFISAALTDLFIIYLLTKPQPTELITQIQAICIAFILLNFMGWISYMLYFSPELYDFLCAVLYAMMLITVTTRKTGYVGSDTMDSMDTGFLSHNPTGLYIVPTDSCKEKT